MTINRFVKRLLFGVAICVFVSSCASPIARRYHEEAAPGATFPMVLENPAAHKGETVVWGGTIFKAAEDKEGSEIYILDLPLGPRDRPEAGENPRGRFIARSKAYLDPLIYRKGRNVTIAGILAGGREVVNSKSGRAYVYPVVTIEEIHLWKKERSAYAYPYYPYGWGWGGPGPYYWGPGRGPWPYWGGFYGGYGWGDEFGGGEEFEHEHHEGGFEGERHFEGGERGEEHRR